MFERFRRSAQINSDNWRDPQHDLEAIRLATPQERSEIETFLIARGVVHFMDAEALALLDTPRARDALLSAFRRGKAEIRAAVVYLAPELIAHDERQKELLDRIATCDAYEGLSLTLTQIQLDHSPAVIDAMLRRMARDPGTAAVHFAAMLFLLCGITEEPFDWKFRPFFLRFNPGDEVDRRAAFEEICQRINQDVTRYEEFWK